jgi:hypothetical protein
MMPRYEKLDPPRLITPDSPPYWDMLYARVRDAKCAKLRTGCVSGRSPRSGNMHDYESFVQRLVGIHAILFPLHPQAYLTIM